MDWREGEGAVGGGAEGTEEGAGVVPAGLQALLARCSEMYPGQPNPLQVTALLKYWLGGPDPLDYISMYANPGNPKLNIPPHWHYVSFGCSDLHGDGRVHEQTGPEGPSGFGFELTMRLKREEGEKSPPTWPAAIMQALAKYVFQSESILCVGDHVSWHCPLDNSESRVQHMLMAEDPQLGSVNTPNGSVQFVQIVGVTTEELRAAQHWNGVGVLDIMKRMPSAGGLWLVTDMRRGESIYELEPSVAEEVENGIESEGSNLSGVSSRIVWTETEMGGILAPLSVHSLKAQTELESESMPHITHVESEQIKTTLQKGLLQGGKSCSTQGKEASEGNVEGNVATSDSAELFVTRRLESLHLTINLESGALLPLALRGRLKHGRHFTFKSVVDVGAVTLVSPAVAGAFVDATCPYAVRGPWLQVFIADDFLPTLVEDLADLADPDEVSLPTTFRWPNRKLTITIVAEET
ncbi:suppressor of fused homolog isoform X1 [Portunus trituberculatus]|uniref:suppressor of fused homolog isoform X1 n=1 Tax=Portunus trituberculatus TaxID=210409 RepID=UPI001E1CF282|nr:suppressor of fused homolog isoform X1 [Portunus trituberculatus]